MVWKRWRRENSQPPPGIELLNPHRGKSRNPQPAESSSNPRNEPGFSRTRGIRKSLITCIPTKCFHSVHTKENETRSWERNENSRGDEAKSRLNSVNVYYDSDLIEKLSDNQLLKHSALGFGQIPLKTYRLIHVT